MTDIFDFPKIEGDRKWKSQDYRIGSPNYLKAWGLLTAVDGLHNILGIINDQGGDYLTDSEKFQLNISRRALHAAESCYWLVKHYQYNAAYDRCRYLFESYWTLSYLNKNKSRSRELWGRYRKEVKNPDSDYMSHVEYAADLLAEVKGIEKNELTEAEEEYSDLYNHLSNRGSHPHSLIGVDSDGRYAPPTEWDILNTSLDLLFGIAAQIIRTVEDTEMRWPVQELVDPIIVDLKMAHEGPPATFLRGDLQFWSPVEFL